MKNSRPEENNSVGKLRRPIFKTRLLAVSIVLAFAVVATFTSWAVVSGQNETQVPVDSQRGVQILPPGKISSDDVPNAGRPTRSELPSESKPEKYQRWFAPAAIVYVDKSGFCDGNPAEQTIQAAINVSSPSGTINVCAGTYVEEINIDKPLTLLGPNANINPNTGARVAEAIIVPATSGPLTGSATNTFGGPIVVSLGTNGGTFSGVDGITFKGFTIDGDNPSLTSGVDYNGADVDAQIGIYGTETANPDAVLSNNIVKNVGEFAIFLTSNNAIGSRDAVSQISSNKVDNVLGRFGQGIRVSDDAWASVLDNVVTRVRNGIVIENFSGNVSTHPASVIGENNVSSFRIGIRHNLHYGYTAPGFTILNNTVRPYVQSVRPPQVTAIETTPTFYQGIRVESIEDTVFVTVSDNNLTGNRTAMSGGGYTRDEGLNVTNSSAVSPNILFSGNSVTDFIRGAYHETDAVPTFTCNSFAGNTTGVYIDPAATNGLIAHNNNIAGNGFGMQNDGPTLVNAQTNWWGAANGPGGPGGSGSGDNVSANVDFSGWLTSPSNCPPTCPTNVALATNGSTASASSTVNANFPASGVINGEHNGNDWGLGGGWNDGTFNDFPDNVDVTFPVPQTISEIDVYTLKDGPNDASVVTPATTFVLYGITAFEVQTSTGGPFTTVPGGNVVGNNLVERKFIFAPIASVTKVRVLVHASADSAASRVVEIEAFSCSPAATPTPTASPTPSVTPTPSPSPTPVPGCVTPPTGMTQWYPFDGNTTDTQSGDNAVPTATPIFEPGEVSTAINFDGTYYAQAPPSGTTDVGTTGDGSLSIDAWIKPAGGSGPLVEWNQGSDVSSTFADIGVHLWLFPDQNTLYANVRDTLVNEHTLSAGGIAVGVYQHVALTYDHATGIAVLYINGAVAATQNLGIFTPKTIGNLNIAHRPPLQNSGTNWNGSMDELEIFNRALSSAEILSIYTAGANGKCKAPTPTPTPTPCNNTNVALATNGSTASASSTVNANFPASGVINGEHNGNDWGIPPYGGWNDGTFNAFPDNVDVTFPVAYTIGEIDVYTLKDDPNSGSLVTPATTFVLYGIRDFEVQTSTGGPFATVPGGNVVGNNKVERQFIFAPIANVTKVRVLVHASADNAASRVVEIEAFSCVVPTPTPTPTVTPSPTPTVSPTPTPSPSPTPCVSPANNVALATNGSTASASSTVNANFPASGVINGEHHGNDWGIPPYGGWNDGTFNVFPDNVDVDFHALQSIGEIDVYTLKDDPNSGSLVTDTTTFVLYGIKDFEVQTSSTGPGGPFTTLPVIGNVTGNNLVKRKFIPATPINATNVRVLVHASADGAASRVVEIEAFSCSPVQVITVDDDFVQCPYAAFDNIPDAIAAASSGAQINVCAGNYPAQVNVNKQLTLHGAQAGNDAQTRSTSLAQEAVINHACGPVQISANNVTVDGFIIQGADSDICTGSPLFGSPLGAGIYTTSANGGYEILNNIIQNNTIGIFLNSGGAPPAEVKFNLIRNNNKSGAVTGTGIYSEFGLANALIAKNTFANHEYASIYFPGTQSFLTISDNELGGGAVLLANTSASSITNNASTGNTGFFFGQIRLFGNDSGIVVSCNLLNGGEKGIRVSAEGGLGTNSNITISPNNTIQGHSIAGLQVDAGSYSGAAGSLDATSNYWGDPSGPNYNTTGLPGSGDAIDDPDLKVNFSGFLSASDSCALAPLAGGNTLVVDDDFAPVFAAQRKSQSPRVVAATPCANAAYSTIGAAILAASPGDTIKVCAGNYPEQVNVNQTLTLLGAQSGQNARTRNTTAAQESVITSTCGPVQISSDGVVIDGFTVEGASGTCGTSFLSGIYTDGSNGDYQILNNIIQNNTQGVFLNNDGDTATVQSNLFQNNNNPGAITGTGIYSANGLDDAVIDNNTFIGHKWGSIYFDGTSSVANVTISGNDLGGGAVLLANTSDSFVNGNVSVGNTGTFFIDQIRFFGGSSDNSINCNHLTGGDRAIRINDDGYGPNSGFTINDNHMQGHAVAGLKVDSLAYTGGPLSLDATSNYWGDPAGPRYNGAGPAAADDILDPDGVVDYSSPATSTPPCAADAAALRPIIQAGIKGEKARTEKAQTRSAQSGGALSKIIPGKRGSKIVPTR